MLFTDSHKNALFTWDMAFINLNTYVFYTLEFRTLSNFESISSLYSKIF